MGANCNCFLKCLAKKLSEKNEEPYHITITWIILQADKFLKCDWLRPVAFKPNLKYLHVKITPVT